MDNYNFQPLGAIPVTPVLLLSEFVAMPTWTSISLEGCQPQMKQA